MEHLRMESIDMTKENVQKIAALFPNCVTEHKDENGNIVLGIDFEKLKIELGDDIIGENEERYQFTWPDKKKAIREANTATTSTLRPCPEESVDFENTKNLYIEGDNLEVLKCLRETYLGKVKMIYIDPPYNTGNDFVYDDAFAKGESEYKDNSGQKDLEGNRLFKNTETNGRFHTDWLNMMYPRLKVARDLLSEDGVIFISIDDNEVENLRKICDEIFGNDHFVAAFTRLTTKSGKTPISYMISHEYALAYVKSKKTVFIGEVYEDDSYKYSDEYIEKRGKYNLKQPLDCNSISYSPSLDYPIEYEGRIYYPGTDKDAYEKRKSGQYLRNDYAWRWSKELFEFGLKNGWIVFQNGRIYTKGYLKAAIEKSSNGYKIEYRTKERKISTIDFISNEFSNDIAKKQVASFGLEAKFDYPKPVNYISKLMSTYYDKNCIVVDFFSGSGTTAESVIKLNSTDFGERRFILVQLPEKLEEGNSGDGLYSNICDMAIERIRRAGKKIKEEHPQAKDLDTGFRVLKLDSSNMEDVYYTPATTHVSLFSQENIKEDRNDLDLLFQVMLESNVELSERIETRKIEGKNVYFVKDNYLVACFDENVTEKVITAIAKEKPYYFVMRDSSLDSDNVADNFEQIFRTYSPDTIRKIL